MGYGEIEKATLAKHILKVLKNWKNLIWWRNICLYKIVIPFLFRKNNGMYILNEKWNNLIILDACRYDVFKEEINKKKIMGHLEYRISRGTETVSFLLENFGSEKHDDIVYITANPFVDRLVRDKFYKIMSVWKEGWDNRHKTVLPETVYEYTLYAIKKYPHKRLIIHFMQPHYPYIGYPFADNSLENLRDATLHNTSPKISKKYKDNIFSLYTTDIYTMIDKETHLEIYKRNFELAMSYVERLINILPGRTVITADHGEAFGERIHPLLPIHIYGHPKKVRIPSLVKVPWFIVEPEEKIPPANIKNEIVAVWEKFTKQEKEKKLKKAIKNLKLRNKI